MAMLPKLFLTVITSGIALLGVILISNQNFPQENTALIQQVETTSPLTTPQNTKIPKPQNTPTQVPKLTASLSPEAVLSTLIPSPLANLLPSLTPAVSVITATVSPSVSSPTPSMAPSPQSQAQHIFYTSSHWKAKYYYCDTDNGWKNLSLTYLKSFGSEEELLKNYQRVLHEPCKN